MLVVNQNHSIPVAFPGTRNVQTLSCYKTPLIFPFSSLLVIQIWRTQSKTENDQEGGMRVGQSVTCNSFPPTEGVTIETRKGKEKVKKLIFY